MAGKAEINHHSEAEIVPLPENYTLTVPYLAISGRSGTGKSHTAELLCQKLGIASENNIKTGALFRKLLEERNITVQGFAKREEEFDRILDENQAELMRTATVESPRIIEGRLAGIISHELKHGKTSSLLQGVSLLFVCEKQEREKRQIGRESLSKKDQKTIIEQNFDRDTRDFAFWQDMHPMLAEKTIEDLYDEFPGKDSTLSNPLYDMVINTTHSSVEQVTQTILDLLVQKGFAKRR